MAILNQLRGAAGKGMYNGESAVNDAIMPAGFFQDADNLFGSGGNNQKGVEKKAVSRLLSIMGGPEDNDNFNYFDVPDVNPFIMAAMRKDIKNKNGDNSQPNSFGLLLQGMANKNSSINNLGMNLGSLFDTQNGNDETPKGLRAGVLNENIYSPEDINPEINFQSTAGKVQFIS